MHELPHSPAAERNQAPILAVLHTLLPASGRALEVASGTGQHAAHFAAALPGWQWQPTDLDDAGFDAIRGWAQRAGARNVEAPRRLNAQDAVWPSDGTPFSKPFDLIYAANLLHISPWATSRGLMQGAARHLAPTGQLVVYGPFIETDVTTAASNLAFDADLRRRDASWGLRRLDDVVAEAHAAGLRLAERHALPANNLLLVFAHGS